MKKSLISLGILLAVSCLFFWQIFKGYVPFPGDLLVNTNPYRSLSVLGYGPNAYPNKAQGQDVIAEMYPWRYFSIQELKKGEIPFWDPHNFSGNILMQNLQSSVFNPFTFVFFLLPFTTGWTLFILFQPIFASIFFYLFARELKLSRFASIVGGIAFAFSSYMTVWMEYGNIAATLAYLPLLLFFFLRFIKKQEIKYYVGFIVGASLMLLSGYIQGAFYSYVVVFLFITYTLFPLRKKISKRLFFSLVGMILFPPFLVLFQYLPTLTVFSQSTRWPYSVSQFRTMLEPTWYWVTLFASDFFGNPATRNYYLAITYIERVAYVGVPVLFFAFFAAISRKAYSTFFAILAATLLVVSTNFPGIAFLYTLPIPVINTTVPTRILSIFMFALVVLGTIGVDTFFNEKRIQIKILIGFGSVYPLLWVGVFIAKKIYPQFAGNISITMHNLIIPTFLAFGTIAIALLAKKYTRIAQGMLFLLVVADLFYVFQKITPFSPPQTIYPEHPVVSFLQKNTGINRYWSYGSGYIEANFQTVTGTYSPEGNDPLHVGAYGELLASSYNGKLSSLPPRPDANLAPGYGSDGIRNNQYRQTLLNLLGIKYIVQHDEAIANGNADISTFPSKVYSLVWSQSPWQIYQNKNALPRYFLVNGYTIAHGQQALNMLYNSDLSQKVILSTHPSLAPLPHATGSVSLLTYKPQRIIFRTNTDGPMLLFLSDTYYPEWGATIDGKSVSILLADFAFRAVAVPKGEHTIVMQYQPTSFNKGLVISLVVLLFFALSIVLLKKYEK